MTRPRHPKKKALVKRVTPQKRVVVVEDQTILRDLIVEFVGEFPDMKVVGQSGDGLDGYELCVSLSPDLVILDVLLPNLNGCEILRRLKARDPDVRVLIFSASSSISMVHRLLRMGATGYVEKDAGVQELRKALARVAEGRPYFTPRIAEIKRGIGYTESKKDALEFLTVREREILQLVAESHSNRQIGEKLGMSARTVDTHRTNVMRKLDLHDIAALTRWAIANTLVDPMEGNGRL